MLTNYRFCNKCESCESYKEINEGRGYCSFQQDNVNGFYTCDSWEENFEEE